MNARNDPTCAAPSGVLSVRVRDIVTVSRGCARASARMHLLWFIYEYPGDFGTVIGPHKEKFASAHASRFPRKITSLRPAFSILHCPSRYTVCRRNFLDSPCDNLYGYDNSLVGRGKSGIYLRSIILYSEPSVIIILYVDD